MPLILGMIVWPGHGRKRITVRQYGMALNHLPSGRFAANGAWLVVHGLAHHLAHWTARRTYLAPAVR